MIMKIYRYRPFLNSRVAHSFFLLSFILLYCQSFAQHAVKRSLYQAIVNFQGGQSAKGILYKVNETSIELLESVKEIGDTIGSQTFEIVDIKSISIRKKGSAGIGLAIGATIGGAFGTLIILQSYPGTYDVTPAIIAGATTLGGALWGANYFGKKTYKIEGNQKFFESAKLALKKRQLKMN